MSPDGGATWTLRLEGTLKGEWVRELRRSWRRIREAAAGAPIRVELADVTFVDAAGKVLLAEMYRGGVEIVARDCLTVAVRDEIVAGTCTHGDSGGTPQKGARASKPVS